MKKMYTRILFICVGFISISIHAQQNNPLTVEKIMRDPKWIGTSPSNLFWSNDGKTLFFNWNPDNNPGDSLYSYSVHGKKTEKISYPERQKTIPVNRVIFNSSRSAFTYEKDGNIFYTEIKTGSAKQITNTTTEESNPVFSFGETEIVYESTGELFAWNIKNGGTKQLTSIQKENKEKKNKDSSDQQKWLTEDQLRYFEVLKSRKNKRDETETYNKAHKQKAAIRKIDFNDRDIFNTRISPNGRFISYTLQKRAKDVVRTIVPQYVTESGYTEDIAARAKVGEQQSTSEFFIYDRQADTIIKIVIDSIPGMRDVPAYIKENYPEQAKSIEKKNELRNVRMAGPLWSPAGTYAVVDFSSIDNKDRWIMLLDAATGKLKLLDRQHDDAWIGGPGTSGSDVNKGWLTETKLWFRSEASGYSHLYTIDVATGERKALTSGQYEVQQAKLSLDKKYFYIATNEVHPGEQQFYRLSIPDGKKERITTMEGSNKVIISPDEKYIAILYSYFNKPWELYLQENKPGGKLVQITNKAQSAEFKAYPWRVPELTTFKARDNADVYARIYKPTNPHPSKPAVIFVHGAGYLQNAHKWWSDYFREYMFHNLLADNGYYVMDIDYRGSAGYGRDWRTGIYRYMGGKDLNDNLDAANYLVKNFGVDPKRIGVYGGSYGGFITLMALFTAPDAFAAGAALRPVTNWSNYNDGYTSDILNYPATDSIAYRRSSPLYFAEGLKGHLLMCHGMLDVNVHFQDVVQLSQRLIELGKNNWELAPYPMEDHGFVEPSSWTDEYKRILKLFESVLKSPAK